MISACRNQHTAGMAISHSGQPRAKCRMIRITISTSQKSCHNIRKTVTSELRNELGVAIAARVAGHKNESTTDQHYSFSTRSNERYASEYSHVIDKKVPEYLKEIQFNSVFNVFKRVQNP